MFIKKFLSISCTLLILLTSACTNNAPISPKASPSPVPTKSVIKVASASPLTGDQSEIGLGLRNGAKSAYKDRIEEFSKLGFELQFVEKDDQAREITGITVADELLKDKDVLGVVGHMNSGVSVVASEKYKTDNLTMISASSTAVVLTERGLKNVFRTVTRDDIQGPVAAKYIFSDLNVDSIYLVNDSSVYGKGIADQFKESYEKLGGKVLAYDTFSQKELDFSKILAKIETLKPKLLFFGGMYAEAGYLVRQMRDKKLSTTFFGPDGLDAPDFVKLGGNSVIGVFSTTVASDFTKTPLGNEWAKKYETEYKSKPLNYCGYSFDSMNVLLNAIKTAIQSNGNKKPSREQVLTATQNTKNYEGISTKVSFNQKGDNLDANVFLFKYKEAKYPPDLEKGIPAKEFLK